jgi:hypothetical protein
VTDPAAPQPSKAARPPGGRPSLDDVFGDVLPDVTDDERAPESGVANADAWYQENRPPHHDQR